MDHVKEKWFIVNICLIQFPVIHILCYSMPKIEECIFFIMNSERNTVYRKKSVLWIVFVQEE